MLSPLLMWQFKSPSRVFRLFDCRGSSSASEASCQAGLRIPLFFVSFCREKRRLFGLEMCGRASRAVRIPLMGAPGPRRMCHHVPETSRSPEKYPRIPINVQNGRMQELRAALRCFPVRSQSRGMQVSTSTLFRLSRKAFCGRLQATPRLQNRLLKEGLLEREPGTGEA